MANRIPQSLNWLIDKRARIAGEIAKTKRSLNEAKALIKDLEELEVKLNAIDTTLDLHHIKVDVSLIAPINSHELRIKLPHGELSNSILTCIRLHQANGPVSKDFIERFLLNKYYDFEGVKVDSKYFKRTLHRALGNLYHSGYLERNHSPEVNDMGLWTLSKKCTID